MNILFILFPFLSAFMSTQTSDMSRQIALCKHSARNHGATYHDVTIEQILGLLHNNFTNGVPETSEITNL